MEVTLKSQENYDGNSIGSYSEDDYIEPINIELYNFQGIPAFYSSEFATAVCEDKICELLHIKLFWDLTGNYIGYDTLAGHPLTKFDHEPFEKEDYIKLHELLMNDGTILKFKRKDELIDKKILRPSDVIDGTTGATALEIKEEVVKGALYTSYTLWHIAHKGEIQNLLNEQTKKSYTKELAIEMMNSDRDSYRIFAVDQLSVDELSENIPFLIIGLKQGNPLLRKTILQKVPSPLWNDLDFQAKVCSLYGLLDVNSRFYLLQSLKEVALVYSQSLEELSKYLNKMSKNQLLEYLELVSKSGELSNSLKTNLSEFARSENRYSYLVMDSGIVED
ncbi:hypothetical protein [Echinicola salinicaeni]|uniref:hypothetical protein n=1 Tax=Echinicola salinicaeni TaxID=2762757 RepID=UPI001644E4A1|nr:hypothetical protein [Echinicola salinicaeni]